MIIQKGAEIMERYDLPKDRFGECAKELFGDIEPGKQVSVSVKLDNDELYLEKQLQNAGFYISGHWDERDKHHIITRYYFITKVEK